MSFIDLSEQPSEPKLVKEILRDDYRFHEMTNGSYFVFKDVDEEPCYEIDAEFGCNCPSATYRNKTCKHEKMVGFERFAVNEDDSDNPVDHAKGSEGDDQGALLDLLE